MGRQIQVFVRLYPIPKRDWKYIQISKDYKDIFIKSSELNPPESKTIKNVEGATDKFVRFKTSGLFINVDQNQLYNEVSHNLFKRVFKGENAIIMVNGPHNSGKSFTMTGYGGSFENRGISLRLIEDLLNEMESRKEEIYSELFISHVDFASDTMIDLLTEPARVITNLSELTRVKYKNREQIVKTMVLGEKRRWLERAGSHCCSSVFTIYLKCTSRIKSQPYDFYPRVDLVELGGAAPCQAPGCQRNVNIDTSAVSLHLVTPPFVRNIRSSSKLVTFLAPSWNNSFIRIVSHVVPTPEYRGANTSALLLSSRLAGRPPHSLSFQRHTNPSNALHYATEMVRRLEEELLVREMMTGEGFRHDSTVGQAQMDSLLSACTQYLEGRLSIESLLSTAHPHLIIRALNSKFQMIQNKDGSYYHQSLLSTMPSQRLDRGAPKLSVSKKRVGSSKKGRLTVPDILTEGAVSTILSDEAPLSGAVGERPLDRQAIEVEFFARYPHLRTQVDAAQELCVTTLKTRNEAYEEFERLKKEAKEEREVEEEAMWKRRLDMEDCMVTGVGAGPEAGAAAAAAAAKKEAVEALIAFNLARDALADLNSSIEHKIQEYMEKVYGVWSPPVEAQDNRLCYVETPDSNQTNLADTLNNTSKIKYAFYSVQKSKNQSSPFHRVKRWV